MYTIQLRRLQKPISEADVRRLVRWRRQNSFAYAQQPHVTVKSMKWWLKNHLFVKKKCLYWVMVNNRKVGHMGLANVKDDIWEVDNVSRGIKSYRGAMGHALHLLMEIAHEKADKLYLRVLEDNSHAIAWYKKHGFKTRHKVKASKDKKFLVMLYEPTHSQ